MRKARAGLIASLCIGLLAVTTAGVSTYAWFVSNSSATITANSSETTITANKPDDYAFYGYIGNTASHTYTGTFATDFEAITSLNLAAKTSFSNCYPTQAMTFAVVMTGCTIGEYIDLDLTKVTSNNINNQDGAKHRYISSTSTEINIGWAIDIYTKCVASPNSNYNDLINQTNTLSASDKFGCTSVNTSTYLAGSRTDNVITLSSSKSLYHATATATTMYLFYTVYFSNASTTWYSEVDGSGNAMTVPGTGSTRYFVSDTSTGNSNCYAGLTFALNELSLTF